MTIGILGFGREGKSILRYLRRSGNMKRNEIWILDRDPGVKPPRGVRAAVGPAYLKNLARFDVVFRSPGVPYSLPALTHARRAGVILSSATKLFFQEIRAMQKRHGGKPLLIGVTGTKGKGTTSTLIYRMLRSAKKRVLLAGNIGTPMLDYLPKAARANYIVLELSSFQLQDLEDSPEIAVVLDVFPDHLDAHKNLREYYDAKTAIGTHQRKSDMIAYFDANPVTRRIALQSPARKIPVRPKENNLRKNFDMAAAVAKYLGVSARRIASVIAGFKGMPHRLEFVRKLRDVKFYNDSAGTNPKATEAAVRSFTEPIILIAGGKNKGFVYRGLGAAIRRSSVREVVLIGEVKAKMKREMALRALPVTFLQTLGGAVRYAYRRAKLCAGENRPAVVLFSPAATSFDMFKNYADRGMKFKTLVRRLK